MSAENDERCPECRCSDQEVVAVRDVHRPARSGGQRATGVRDIEVWCRQCGKFILRRAR